MTWAESRADADPPVDASAAAEATGVQAVECPFCGSERTELIALHGSQLLTSQYRCTACHTYFEGIRDDHWDDGSADTNRRTEP